MNPLAHIARVLRGGRPPPRPWRPAWLPSDYKLTAECNVHPHVPAERAELFLAYNAGTTEMETLNWLHATLCLLKPRHVLETGAADGLGTVALASACRANGFGMVHSVEIDPRLCAQLQVRLAKHGLSRFAQVHCAASLDFLRSTELTFDFGFYDSLCEIRADEYALSLERGLIRGPAAFHDTSPTRTDSLPNYPTRELHEAFRTRVLELAQTRGSAVFDHRLARGLIVVFPRQS